MNGMVNQMTKQEIEQKAALTLIVSGQATVGEVAHLRGVSRQYLQRLAGEQARMQRKRHLKMLWKKTVEQLS